jgi:hypothetical protein
VRELSALAATGTGLPTGAAEAVAASSADAGRLAELELENADLRARLAEAAERTRAMTDRMRFLRQQQESDGEQ